MAELQACARSTVFHRAPNRTASRRAPSPTAMPVRVTPWSQDQQPNASEASHIGSARVIKLYNPAGDVKGAQPNPVPKKKTTKPMKAADREQNPCTAVYRRPYRDRVIHLLALRTYKKPELLAHLQRDGLMQKDKDSLGKILQQVANLNAKDNSFSLKEHLFQTLQTDWPGYTETDRQNLKLILSRKSTPSQSTTSTSQATSLGPSERDAPARPAQKRTLDSDFSGPVKSKKRIARQHSYIQPATGHSSSWAPTLTYNYTSYLPPSVASIFPCTREVQEEDKFQSSNVPVPAMVQKEIPNSNKTKNELGRLKQLRHFDSDEEKRKDTSIASTYSATKDQPDYLRKYVAIVSLEQCQRYKEDFNVEYEEYQYLHTQIEETIKHFTRLSEQWKSLHVGSEAYRVLAHRILADYQQLQQGSPSYSEMRSRCQYLHQKLSHIQSCISEFEKQQGKSCHQTSASA